MQIGSFLEQAKFLFVHHGVYMTPEDWDDPYLYGYLAGATHVLLKVGSQGKLQGDELAEVQGWGWSELTSLPELLFYTRVRLYSGGESKEFKRGSDAGILWACLLTGIAKRSEKSVEEAIEAGRELSLLNQYPDPQSNEYSDAAAFVMTRDFFEYVRYKKLAA